MRSDWLVRLWYSFSAGGLFLGTLFFAASLTPTLIPRTFLTQGVLSGCSLAAGYGVGVFGRWLYTYLELPRPQVRILRITKLVAAGVCLLVAVAFLWRAAQWQNSIRKLMELEPVASAHPLEVGVIALATFAILIALARLFQLTFRVVSARVHRFMPKRVSNVIGVVAAVVLFWSLISGVLFRVALHVADSSFQRYDALIEPESKRPTAPLKTGSSASLLAWDELGRAGREFISSGPTGEDIRAFSGRDALEPIRVYVGLRSAETPEARARLALEELKRVGGFERSVLIVVTPTGTGWIDPAAMNSVEYLHNGDVASVALQYSYLASWLSLIAEPGYGADAARALFKEVYGYWTKLPQGQAPETLSAWPEPGREEFRTIDRPVRGASGPIDGALWSGPPYSSALWRSITADRNPGSPAWLPQFRDGSFVRFMNQDGAAEAPGSALGPDADRLSPVCKRSGDILRLSRPLSRTRLDEASAGPRRVAAVAMVPGRDPASAKVDMATATTTPMGYGHVFAPAHYVDAWIEVTDVKGWSPDEIARLKRHLAEP